MDLTLDWSKPLAPPSAGIDFVTDSVAVAPDGTVLVLDAVKSKVSRFASDGKLLGSWGKPGHGKGQFDFLREGETVLISGIAVGPDGTVFVADEGNYRIQAFDPSGKFLRAFGGQGAGGGTFQRVVGVATDGRGFVYATDGDAPRFSLQEYDSKGAFVAEFAAKGAGEDHISRNGARQPGRPPTARSTWATTS
jgi:tripartite motif-containing protein 71